MCLRARFAVFLTAALTAAFIAVPASAAESAATPSGSGATVIDPFPNGVTRLSGDDRYLTAIAGSKRFSPGVPVVFVAAGEDFPDALSASAAAALLGGPLLLTPAAKLTPEVTAEIKRLAPAEIYAVGGASVVSKSVVTTLATIASTTRLSGANRYSTGLAVISSTFDRATEAIIATGRSFPDALSASGAAGARDAPVVLVDGINPTVTKATLDELKRLGVAKVSIAGGVGAVSAGIESQLVSKGFTVVRHGGKTRYDTAALINDAYFEPAPATSTVFLAAGGNFPDALAGAAIAGRLGAPLYITQSACTPRAVHESINRLSASKFAVMGGKSVVSDAAAENTKCVPPTAKISVMTYNLCGQDRICLGNGIEKWSTRKPLAGKLVRDSGADIIATQESHSRDTQFETELPGFDRAAYYSAKSLYYDTSKFTVEDSGTITLNATERKYAVWAEFRDIDSHIRFIVADAHLQSVKGKQKDDMRFAQTNVLISQIAKNNPDELPVIYAGDYNSNKSNANQDRYPGGYDAPLKVFTAAGIPDSIDVVPDTQRLNADWNSANQAKNPPLRYGDHVDHIYVDPTIIVNRWAMLLRITADPDPLYTLPFATDHNAIQVDLTIEAG